MLFSNHIHEKNTFQYFLNKIPKSIVVKKGFAVTAKDYKEAKEFAMRHNITKEFLLCESSNSQTTLYFTSDALDEMAYQMLYAHNEAELLKREKEKTLIQWIRGYFKSTI